MTITNQLAHRRYHIVEEFNRGIYDYLIASDEAELKGELDSDDEEDQEQEKPSVSKDEEENDTKKG